MDLQFISLTVFSTCFFVVVLLRIVRSNAWKPGRRSRLPPGPFKLPLIGNIHNLIGSLPHHKLRVLAKVYGPLMHLQLGQVPTIVVSSAEIAREVLKTHDLVFSQRPFLLAAKIMSYDATSIIFSRYNERWRQQRKICAAEVLSAKRVESFRPIREQEVGALLKRISSNEGSPINVSKLVFSMTYSIISKCAAGGGCRDPGVLASVLRDVVESASGFSLADMYPSCGIIQKVSGLRRRLEKLFAKSDKVLQEILDYHRMNREVEPGNENEDLVDVLLRLQRQGNLDFALSDDNIKGVILDVFGAGAETSSTTVEWALSELLRNPTLMKMAQQEVRRVFDDKGSVDEEGLQELEFLKSVVKETLRLHPPGPLLLPREAGEDCVIKGYEIRANTKVLVNAWAIHRDPEFWKEPETFNPKRFLERSVDFKGTDFSYLPFGSGRRVCPGILFAISDIELPLANLLYHFDWKLGDGTRLENLDMNEAFGVSVRRKKDLILVPIGSRPLAV